MNQPVDYITTMNLHLKQWDAEFAAVAAEAESVAEEARAAHKQHVLDMQACRDAAHLQFDQYRTADDTARAELRMGMDAALVALQSAMNSVMANAGKQPRRGGDRRAG